MFDRAFNVVNIYPNLNQLNIWDTSNNDFKLVVNAEHYGVSQSKPKVVVILH